MLLQDGQGDGDGAAIKQALRQQRADQQSAQRGAERGEAVLLHLVHLLGGEMCERKHGGAARVEQARGAEWQQHGHAQTAHHQTERPEEDHGHLLVPVPLQRQCAVDEAFAEAQAEVPTQLQAEQQRRADGGRLDQEHAHQRVGAVEPNVRQRVRVQHLYTCG